MCGLALGGEPVEVAAAVEIVEARDRARVVRALEVLPLGELVEVAIEVLGRGELEEEARPGEPVADLGGAELDNVVLLRLDEDLKEGAVVRSVLGGDVAKERNGVEETDAGRARERCDGGVAAGRVLRHWGSLRSLGRIDPGADIAWGITSS